MTREEKVAMYMKLSKKELVEMLLDREPTVCNHEYRDMGTAGHKCWKCGKPSPYYCHPPAMTITYDF